MKKSSLAVLLVATLPPLALAGCQTVEEDGYGYSTTYSTTVYDDVYVERPVYRGGYTEQRSRSDWDRGRRPPPSDWGRRGPPPSGWNGRGPSPTPDAGRQTRPMPDVARRTPTPWGAGPSGPGPTVRTTPAPTLSARPPQGSPQGRGSTPWTPDALPPGAAGAR